MGTLVQHCKHIGLAMQSNDEENKTYNQTTLTSVQEKEMLLSKDIQGTPFKILNPPPLSNGSLKNKCLNTMQHIYTLRISIV